MTLGGPYRSKFGELSSIPRRDLSESEKKAINLLRTLAERIEEGDTCEVRHMEQTEEYVASSVTGVSATQVSLRVTVSIPGLE